MRTLSFSTVIILFASFLQRWSLEKRVILQYRLCFYRIQLLFTLAARRVLAAESLSR
jgi:hypothetical protein